MHLRPSNEAHSRIWLAKILVTAGSYYVAGRLGLLLVIPPDYASPIWVPAGVALSAILLFGYPLWLGIYLGAFAVNLWVLLYSPPVLQLNMALFVSAVIAMGASLQAIIGAFLVRRYVGFPTPLTKPDEIGKFLLLGGPLSCVINPVVSVTTLLLIGRIQSDAYWFTFWTWWVGDAIGAMTVAPLIFIIFAEPRDIWRRRHKSVAIPLVVLFSLIVTFFLYARTSEDAHIRDEFNWRAEELTQAVQKHLQNHLEVLHSIESLYMASGEVTRREFRDFVQRSLMRYPSLRGLSWNPYIPHSERRKMEAAARKDGYPNFELTEYGATGHLVTAGTRPFYVLPFYIEPYERNERALGFDVASMAARREAFERARDEARPIATTWIRLVQESRDEPGFLVFVPIYRNGVSVDTLEKRRKYVQGYAVGVFQVSDIIQASLKGMKRDHIVLRIQDAEPGQEQITYMNPDGRGSEIREESVLRLTKTIDVAGRKWLINFLATPSYVASKQTWESWGILAAGLTVVALFGAYLLVVTGNAYELEGAAEKLRRANNVKHEFLNVMSHELRTPLNVIMGYVTILKEGLFGEVNPKQQEALEKVLGETREQLVMIDSMLQVAQLESGTPIIDREIVDVRATLESLQALYVSPRGKDVVLTWNLPPTLPPITTDLTKLKQILQNLISNALKFTEKGSVRVSVEHSPEVNSIRFVVRDTGIGIPRENLSLIFNKFEQIDSSDRRPYGGTGLGLYIASQFSELLGGKLEVQSEPGVGSTFTLILPLEELNPSAEHPLAYPNHLQLSKTAEQE